MPSETTGERGVAIDGRHVEAVDRILAIAARERRRHRYQTSPFSLRFVAPSEAYASMMHGRATMMIELIMVTGTRHGYELLATYEDALADLDVRPHWGQYNTLTPERIARNAPLSLRGFERAVAYSASKHAVLGITRSVAREVARRGIRVNAVLPGPIEGRMLTSIA